VVYVRFLDPVSIEEVSDDQHGQVFKLKAKGADGQPLWAYRYWVEGGGSSRPQVGGFLTCAEAEKALRKVVDRLGPGGGRATITLAEFVDEYLEMHQAAAVTIAKRDGCSARRPRSSETRGWRICRRGTCTPGGGRFPKVTRTKRPRHFGKC
jgi:hypothetical protein